MLRSSDAMILVLGLRGTFSFGVSRSGGARILEQVGPAAGSKVVW